MYAQPALPSFRTAVVSSLNMMHAEDAGVAQTSHSMSATRLNSPPWLRRGGGGWPRAFALPAPPPHAHRLPVEAATRMGYSGKVASHDTLFVSWAFSPAIRFRQLDTINLNGARSHNLLVEREVVIARPPPVLRLRCQPLAHEVQVLAGERATRVDNTAAMQKSPRHKKRVVATRFLQDASLLRMDRLD